MEEELDPAVALAAASLTERQREVLRLVSRDMNSKEIGRRLGLSDETVKNHVKAAVRRLGVTSRFDAARLLRLHERSDPRVVNDPSRVIRFPAPPTDEVRDGAGRTGVELREARARFDVREPVADPALRAMPSWSPEGGRAGLTGLRCVCWIALLTAAVAVAGVAAAPLARSVQELTNMIEAPHGQR